MLWGAQGVDVVWEAVGGEMLALGVQKCDLVTDIHACGFRGEAVGGEMLATGVHRYE